MAETMRAIGLMSGTSMDGVDLALLETDGEEIVRPVTSAFRPYHEDERAILRRALDEAATLSDRDARPPALAEAEAVVTTAHIQVVADFLGARQMTPDMIDIVGFHGQTVFHAPGRGLTIQIGDGQRLADEIGIPVVYDFRAADVAAGGQGAPFVPAYHRALVRSSELPLPVAVLNIGGVANVTFIGRDGDPAAFDTGPGNALIDDLMRERTGAALDKDGRLAAEGRVDERALAALMSHPYFEEAYPKSLDRNAFSRAAVSSLSTADAAATLTAFTAASIAGALRLLSARPGRLVVCGGGARNPTLLAALQERAGIKVSTAEEFGWSADSVEAEAFAYLAVRSRRGLPLTFPGTTGVELPTRGGVLVRPS